MSQEERLEIIQDKDWTIIVLSPSSLDLLQQCELAYYFGKIRHLKRIDSSSALDRGIVFHRLLEMHYNLIKAGEPYQLVVDKVQQEINVLAVNESDLEEAAIEEIRRVYVKYAQFYADDEFLPVAVESPFSYVFHEDPVNKIRVVFEGRIDLILETSNQEELIVVDHKTKSRQERYTRLENQPSVYSLVTGIRTVQINEIGFQKEPIFRRVPLFYQESMWNEFRATAIKWVARLLQDIQSDSWLANNGSCKYCSFKEICETEEKAREFKISTFFKKGGEFDVYKK